jgi:hypothetical protein
LVALALKLVALAVALFLPAEMGAFLPEDNDYLTSLHRRLLPVK